jgi:hypothetical protein
MKVAIVVMIVLVLGFVALLFRSGNDDMAFFGFELPKDTKSADDLSEWKAPGVSGLIASIGELIDVPPRAQFDQSMLSLEPRASVTLLAKSSDEKMEILRVRVGGAGVLLVDYNCEEGGDRSCPQKRCLCRDGSPTGDPLLTVMCDRDFGRDVTNGRCSGEDRQETSIFIYPDRRTVQFTGLGPSGVTVELN